MMDVRSVQIVIGLYVIYKLYEMTTKKAGEFSGLFDSYILKISFLNMQLDYKLDAQAPVI